MAVEACKATAMVRGVGKQNPPMRQFHQPSPTCRLGEDVRETAVQLLNTVRAHFLQQHHSATYLFVDPEGNCYAISERRSVAQVWVREHIAWLVGRYAPMDRSARADAKRRGIPWIEPTVDGLVEDLTDHMRQLGVGR